MDLRRVWFIALRELRQFMADRLALFFFILFPFLFITMFNLLLGNLGGEDNRLELHLVTRESNGISQQIIQALETRDESQLNPGEPKIIWDQDYNQSMEDVNAGRITGFLAFPADFTEAVMMGSGTNLEIVTHAESVDTRMALNGLAQGIISRVSAQRVQMNAIIALLTDQQSQSGGSQEEIQQALAQIFQDPEGITEGQSLINYQTENVGEIQPLNPASYVVPGYLVMFVFFAAALSAESIVRERRNHTLERLLAGSTRRETLLGGLFLGGLLKGLLQIAIFWTVGILVFNVNIGSAPWAVIGISILMVIMSAAFSLMLATLAKTERSAGSIGVITSLILAPLGGCWWPLFITPQWMQFIAKITPHGWANAGFNKLMLFGADASAVVWEMAALAGFAIIFIIIAIIKFRTSADAT